MGIKAIFTLLVCLFLSNSQIFSQIVISEIQAAPNGDEPEWLELINLSDTAVFISGLRISDAGTDKPLPFLILAGKAYAVVTKDTAALLLFRKIPKNAVLLEAKLPVFNNDRDMAVLRKDSITIDSLFYDMSWGHKGISLERRDCSLPACSRDNLGPSESPDSATAGYANSIFTKPIDISCTVNPGNDLSFIIANCGKYKIESCQFNLYIDYDENNICYKNERIDQVSLNQDFKPGDTLVKSYTEAEISKFLKHKGYVHIYGIVYTERDETYRNDTARVNKYFSYPPGSVLINEFMFDVSSAGSEFVELWNAGDDTVSLSGWSVCDESAINNGNGATIPASELVLAPGSLAVVAWDSAIIVAFPYIADCGCLFIASPAINLNADGDIIVLKEPNGNMQDSLSYSNKWHTGDIGSTKDRSLEKYNPSLASSNPASWTTCGDTRGATPGISNSVSRSIPPGSGLTADPNPFSASGADGNNKCMISYKLPFAQANVKLEIYDTNGNIVRSLLNNSYSAAEGIAAWEGKNDKGYQLPAGPYILFLEAVEAGTNSVYQEKMLIVQGNAE